jgi:hypothetical protein
MTRLAELLARDGDLSDRLYLVNKGIPFDVAFSLDDEMRMAWVVIFGTHDGGEFDWTTMSWKKRDA